MSAPKISWIAVTDKYIREPFRFDYTCDYLINANEGVPYDALSLAANLNDASRLDSIYK